MCVAISRACYFFIFYFICFLFYCLKMPTAQYIHNSAMINSASAVLGNISETYFRKHFHWRAWGDSRTQQVKRLGSNRLPQTSSNHLSVHSCPLFPTSQFILKLIYRKPWLPTNFSGKLQCSRTQVGVHIRLMRVRCL